MNRTLGIIKPDSVEKGNTGKILQIYESNGFRIKGIRMVHLSKEEAERFYHIHRGKPFFESLVEFMTSGPAIVMVLEKEGAVWKNRELMGATDPKEAGPGTIRALFGESIGRNAIHGSDSEENARREIDFFFKREDIF